MRDRRGGEKTEARKSKIRDKIGKKETQYEQETDRDKWKDEKTRTSSQDLFGEMSQENLHKPEGARLRLNDFGESRWHAESTGESFPCYAIYGPMVLY